MSRNNACVCPMQNDTCSYIAGADRGRVGDTGGHHHLPGGAARADSTPGSLWLDGGAKVITGDEQRLSGHLGPVLCLAVSGERLFSSSTDLTIKVQARRFSILHHLLVSTSMSRCSIS